MLRVQQVGRTASTSMRLQGGLMSLVAVMAWGRRYGRSWAVSLPMAVGVCLAAWAHALGGARPASLHRAHGAPCTRLACTGRLAAGGRQSSRDGRGRARDTVCSERLWRTLT